LEQASFAKDYVQPRVQLGLSRWGRVGNKRVLVGRKGWLYYTPGVAHLSGPSFIAPDPLARRAVSPANGDVPETHVVPDPRPAIFAFRDALAKRGIQLVLFPVPDKAALQPEHLHGRASTRVPQNIGWPAFARELHEHGVTVFDPSPRQLTPGEAPLFLSQDTHWTPAWMERVASELAGLVERTAALPPAASNHTYRAVSQRVARIGDLVDMLKLPEEQTLFEPQSVTIRQVQDETGAPWEPNPGADVLLLGDSFTNVFSLDAMGWGEAAGLAPHLALALGRDIDVIAQNDSGAFATRQTLARALAAGEDRLRGKRVVIWEFASRELSVGDWKTVVWPEP
jgi:alginate O-acetyltransferase complex protein AlgJ